MKRAQGAMEFLMTYGWAILIVIVAIGALAYSGVLGGAYFLPEKCTISTGSGLFCEDFSASTGKITLIVRNVLANPVQIREAVISQDENSCNLTSIDGNEELPRSIAPSSSAVLILTKGDTCHILTAAGTKLKGDISITFKRKYLLRTTTGDITTKAGEGADYISWWKFDGDATDSGPGNNDGTLIGDATFVNDAEKGRVLSLDGDGDYVSLNNEINIDGNASISFWVKPNTLSGINAMIGKVEDLDNCISYYDGELWLEDAGDTNHYFSTTLTTDWQHLVINRNDIHWIVYLNGVLSDTDEVWDSNGNLLITTIGAGWSYGYEFNGAIDDVMIYNRALELTEIQQIYCNQGGTC